MARSRNYLPRRPLDRLPFAPSSLATRLQRGYDDTIKLSPEYLASLDKRPSKPYRRIPADSTTAQASHIPQEEVAAQASSSTRTSDSTSTSTPSLSLENPMLEKKGVPQPSRPEAVLSPPSMPGQEPLICCNETFLTLDGYAAHRNYRHNDHFHG